VRGVCVQVLEFVRFYYAVRLATAPDYDKRLELLPELRRDMALVYALGVMPAPSETKTEDVVSHLLGAIDAAKQVNDVKRMTSVLERVLTIGISHVTNENVRIPPCVLHFFFGITNCLIFAVE
jgi:hypothetical protein